MPKLKNTRREKGKKKREEGDLIGKDLLEEIDLNLAENKN